MDEARKAAEWMVRTRKERGWSTTDLANETRKIAHARGSKLKLRQQSISAFEKSGKKVPEWFRYAEMALAGPQAEEDAAAPGAPIWIKAELPNAVALKRMFLGALDSIANYRELDESELAERLARHLPALLAAAIGELTQEVGHPPAQPPAEPRSPRGKSSHE